MDRWLAVWAQDRRRSRDRGPYLVLTNPTDRIGFYVRGTGTLTVDWGDGTEASYTLSSFAQNVARVYASAAVRTVRLVGNVTSLEADASAGLGGVGSASFAGDISTLTSLTYLNVTGGNTLSGAVTGLALTRLYVTGANTLRGSVTGMPLAILCVLGSNTVGGDVTGLPLTFLYLGGSNTVSGEVGSLTSLAYLYEVTATYVTHPATWIGLTGLCYVYVRNLSTQAAVDDLLVSMDANKGATKTRLERAVVCTSGCAAPSATGLAAKASLAAAGWTVTTN